MKNLVKSIRKLNKSTKQLLATYIICMLVFICFEYIYLYGLKKDINQMNKTISTAFDDFAISNEPDMETELPYKKLGKFKLSWYSPQELGKQHPHQLRTSKGKIPQSKWTIAVDPKVIPYGSIVYIQGYGYYVAEDCGGAIKGNRIDIFTASHKEAIQNGRKVANVYLLR